MGGGNKFVKVRHILIRQRDSGGVRSCETTGDAKLDGISRRLSMITYAKAYVTEVYLVQLMAEMGRYWVCQPAYQVVATMSSSPDPDEGVVLEPPAGVEVAVLVGEDVGEGATATADEGSSEHMGAAHAAEKAIANSDSGNMCNMLASVSRS